MKAVALLLTLTVSAGGLLSMGSGADTLDRGTLWAS